MTEPSLANTACRNLSGKCRVNCRKLDLLGANWLLIPTQIKLNLCQYLTSPNTYEKTSMTLHSLLKCVN